MRLIRVNNGLIKMIIDATNMIMGRLGSFAAKKALLGERVDIINCEKTVLSGKKQEVFAKYKRFSDMGVPKKGPFIPRMPDRFMRRVLRGMFPMSKARGREAYKRFMCHIGVPDKFKDKPTEQVRGASTDKLPTLKKVSVGDVCKHLGGKWNE